ncbi:MAG: hypothetical protein Q8M19_09760 [Reyranella sp.]|nr:hypothetical protein [Reyranella sp.]
MPYDVRQWPATIYPGEIDAECPSAREAVDVLLGEMARFGVALEGYQVKALGKANGYLWQVNLKIVRLQVRILFAPYNQKLVLFRIHKKGSPQEQQRAYALAIKRKKEFEDLEKAQEKKAKHGGNFPTH